MQDKSVARYCLEQMAFENGILKITGWAYDQKTHSPAKRIQLHGSRELSSPPTFKIHAASPDLEESFGVTASHTRFAIDIPVVSPTNLTNILLSQLVFQFSDTDQILVSPFPVELTKYLSSIGDLANLKIGIGITTYNRADLISDTVESLRSNSFFSNEIFVADDGSSDNTQSTLEAIKNISWATSKNRGIAWNKNRALFYLHQIKKCDIILLLEDDVRSHKKGWDLDWVLATISFGHVNYAGRWLLRGENSNAAWHNPVRSGIVGGQCSGFTRETLTYVGYLDTRFRKYGHEHVEHTLRMIRAGYGGIIFKENTRDCQFLMLNGGLDLVDAQSSGNSEAVKENGVIFDAIWNESIYRPAWRNDDQMKALKNELSDVISNSPEKGSKIYE